MDSDCKITIMEIVGEIRDKSTYLKFIDAEEIKDKADFYEGMALGYTFILNGIVDYINASDELSLEDVGLDDFQPNEVMSYLER